MNINDVVKAKITSIQQYGLFVDMNGISGFCHISNISNKFIKDIKTIYNMNDYVDVKILSLDDKSKRYIVSIKDAENHIKEHSESFENMLNNYLKISNDKNNDLNRRNNKKSNKRYKK